MACLRSPSLDSRLQSVRMSEGSYSSEDLSRQSIRRAVQDDAMSENSNYGKLDSTIYWSRLRDGLR